MAVEPVWKRKIREVVDRRFDGNMKAASKHAGLNETYIRDLIERNRIPSVENLATFARSVGLPASVFLDEDAVGMQVPVVGYVGAGSEAHYYGASQGPFDYVAMPPQGSPRTVAVSVRGGSMSPAFDEGALLYYDDRQEPPTDGLQGALCVVGLPDGRVLVKRLYRASKRGRWHLHSNEPPILDQVIEWAAKVIWVKL